MHRRCRSTAYKVQHDNGNEGHQLGLPARQLGLCPPRGRIEQGLNGRYGETRTRTGDTTIFSRVLYQLSYLAVEPRG
jgi:hypothetical protein